MIAWPDYPARLPRLNYIGLDKVSACRARTPLQSTATNDCSRPHAAPERLLLLFIGSVIGSGIFLTPGLILRQLNGSVGFSLLVWVVGGVLSLLGALTYAELSATNPEAGGLYCFIRDGFGRMAAFLYGWSLFLVIASGTIAALARAFTRYLAEIIPLSATGATVVSVVMIAVVTAVNVWGTRKSSDLQNWTTLIKTLLIVVLSGFLLSLGHHGGELASAMGTTQEAPRCCRVSAWR